MCYTRVPRDHQPCASCNLVGKIAWCLSVRPRGLTSNCELETPTISITPRSTAVLKTTANHPFNTDRHRQQVGTRTHTGNRLLLNTHTHAHTLTLGHARNYVQRKDTQTRKHPLNARTYTPLEKIPRKHPLNATRAHILKPHTPRHADTLGKHALAHANNPSTRAHARILKNMHAPTLLGRARVYVSFFFLADMFSKGGGRPMALDLVWHTRGRRERRAQLKLEPRCGVQIMTTRT